MRSLVDHIKLLNIQLPPTNIPCKSPLTSLDCPPVIVPSTAPSWPGTGVNLTISCNITSYPMPQVTWYHNSSQIFNTTDIHQVDLVLPYKQDEGVFNVLSSINIRSLAWSDQGHYSCSASNGVGDPVVHKVSLASPQQSLDMSQTYYNLPVVVVVSAITAIVVIL